MRAQALSGCHHSVVFLFFKQKTEYEVRISDWSSDVCSSDLLRADVALLGQLLALCRERIRNLAVPTEVDLVRVVGQWRLVRPTIDQIGRASCRERVCQYV